MHDLLLIKSEISTPIIREDWRETFLFFGLRGLNRKIKSNTQKTFLRFQRSISKVCHCCQKKWGGKFSGSVSTLWKKKHFSPHFHTNPESTQCGKVQILNPKNEQTCGRAASYVIVESFAIKMFSNFENRLFCSTFLLFKVVRRQKCWS